MEFEITRIDCIYVDDTVSLGTVYIDRLSLLTMTNPDQILEVFLFVSSKMADETNLSSKLPVADRTRAI